MTDRHTTALALAILALAAAWWLWRRERAQRDSIQVPGVGRVWLATDEESDYWRKKYAPPEGWYDDYSSDP